MDKRGRPWPRTRYGRPTCPFDELPPGMPAPGTQYELMRKLENPMLFFGDEPMPTVEEFSALAARLRAERAAAGPAIAGALSQGALARAAAGLLGATAAPATLLGGALWPSPTGDSTLAGTGLTLADAPGFEPPTLPDAADPGVSIDPDAGKPTVLVTPAAPQAGPSVEVFDSPSIDPVMFENRTIEQFREKLDRQFGRLKPVDFDAARQEMDGKVVAEKAGGRPYDHVQKVANAMTGVINIIGELTRRLSHPGLSDADRQAAIALLSQASRRIEEARRMVPGIDQRLGDYK